MVLIFHFTRLHCHRRRSRCAPGTVIGTKMTPMHATLTITYVEENLYEIRGKKYNNIKKKNLSDHGKDT